MFAQKIFFSGTRYVDDLYRIFWKLLKLHCMAPQCVSSTFQLSGPFFYLVWWSLENYTLSRKREKRNREEEKSQGSTKYFLPQFLYRHAE